MHGDRDTAVNSPGSPMSCPPDQPLIHGMGPLRGRPKVLDITKQGFSVLGGRNCRANGTEQTRRWYWENGIKYGFMYLKENTYVYMSLIWNEGEYIKRLFGADGADDVSFSFFFADIFVMFI